MITAPTPKQLVASAIAERLLHERITEHLLRGLKRPLSRCLFGKTYFSMTADEQRIYKRIAKRIWNHRNPGQSRLNLQSLRSKWYAQGLTSNGKPRQHFMIGYPKTEQEVKWRQFRATLLQS